MRNLLLVFWVLNFMNYSCVAQTEKQKYFEGKIYFKVSVQALNSNISYEILSKETGDTMIGLVKQNKYLMHQNTNGELGGTKMIFLLDEGLGYIDYEKSDTIFSFSIEENQDSLLEMKISESSEKVILGDNCKSVTFKYIPKETYGVIQYIEAKYYFNSKYLLDKEKYKNHKTGFWDKFVSASNGGASIRNEILTYPLFKTIYEAIRIEEFEVKDSEFELDPSKIVREMKY